MGIDTVTATTLTNRNPNHHVLFTGENTLQTALPIFIYLFFFFEMEFRPCYPDWSAMARSRLTATSAFWVQANSPASPSRVAGITGMRHHAQLIFVFLVETGFHFVDQDGLDLLTS